MECHKESVSVIPQKPSSRCGTSTLNLPRLSAQVELCVLCSCSRNQTLGVTGIGQGKWRTPIELKPSLVQLNGHQNFYARWFQGEIVCNVSAKCAVVYARQSFVSTRRCLASITLQRPFCRFACDAISNRVLRNIDRFPSYSLFSINLFVMYGVLSLIQFCSLGAKLEKRILQVVKG